MSKQAQPKLSIAEAVGPVLVVDDVWFAKEAQSVIMAPETAKVQLDEKNLQPFPVGKYLIAPWGLENLLPQRVMDKIEKVEVVGTNANFNWQVCYGLGPKLQKLVYSDNPNEVVKDAKGNIIGGRVVDRLDIHGGEVYDWCQRADLSLYLQESLTDLSYFHNSFPLLVPDKKEDTIYSIMHREAMFSRWRVNEKGEIISHLYSSNWDDNPGEDNIEESEVIDELDDVLSIKSLLGKKTRPERLIYPLYMPSPGRPYYSYPTWYSIFRSGWYDHLASIPALKKAILKHNLGVKHIIYMSVNYLDEKARQLGVNPNDQKAVNELKKKLVDEINETLTGEGNQGKALAALQKLVPSGNGTTTEKYFTIEKVDNGVEGGEYLTDYETGANVVSYAMGVHPSLIGATPGKNSNSLSGSNQREIFMIKQALSKPMIDRAMRPFAAIKRLNGWDSDLVLTIDEYNFTTLDQAKSGKKEIQNTAV